MTTIKPVFLSALLAATGPVAVANPPEPAATLPPDQSQRAVRPPLTLAEALARVHGSSPRLAAARALLAGADAGSRSAGRAADPTLGLLTENWRGGEFDTSADLDITATWAQPLEVFGTRSGRRAVARGELDEAQASLTITAREVDLETVRVFLAALDGQEMVRALEAQAERLRGIVARLRRQLEEGYTAEAQLMKFTSERARVELELLRTRQQAARDGATLAALLGTPLPAGGLARPPLPAVLTEDPAQLAAAAAARVPAVRVAASRLQRARGAVALERARGRGDLEATAGYKRTGGLDTAVFGLAYTIPLFDRNGWARARAEAEAKALEAELQDAAARAAAQLSVFFTAARDLGERAATIESELIAPAEAAHRAALAAFGEGRVDALELVDAERVFTEARRQALEVSSEAFLVLYEARLYAEQESAP